MTKEELIKGAQELDAQREERKQAKQRKTLTREQKEELEFLKMLNYKEEVLVEEEDSEVKEWDVPADQPIYYFDPDLSYELTGYRPITKDRGLDFDPKEFTKAALHYIEYGRYTDYMEDTFLWREFWLEEARRCREGYTVGKYTLTGENYFFVNYYRLKNPVIGDNILQRRKVSFPEFINKLYEYFHYLELCRRSDHDGIIFKSRGVGASEIAASNAARAYTFIENSYNIITAFAEHQVETTMTKVSEELDFLNEHTENAFSNPRQKFDSKLKKKASLINDDKNEVGWGSVIEGIVADNPDKIRGDRVDNIYFEEAGIHPRLIETYAKSRALVNTMGTRVGNMWVFGTAGSEGPKLEGLKTMFYNPEAYMALPYKNKYTRNGEIAYTGYFIPAFTMWMGRKASNGRPSVKGYDERGVVNEELAKEHYEAIWQASTDPKALLHDKAEFCFTPEDAFVLEGSNAFNAEKLAEQLMNIEQHLVETPKRIRLRWGTLDGKVNRKSIPTAEYVETGLIKIIEPPILDDNGIPYQNLYCAGIDSIDTSADTTTGLTDLSQFCIVIYRRQFGLKDPKIVALYKHRPKQVSDAYDEALKLCQYYNAKALIEATRVGVIEYFKKEGMQYYLMHKPKSVTSGKNSTLYGVPATTAVIERQLLLINDYIENYYIQINYLEAIDEFQRYSYENKRKFDIVAAFGIALLADEELGNKLPKPRENALNKKLSKLCYYKNEYGQIVFGVKPERGPVNYGGLSNYGRLRT